MFDEITMRSRLQTVAAYRALCRSVQRSGRENVLYAVFMLVLAYYLYSVGGQSVAILYGALAGLELLVGLYKWAIPSAEGPLLDSFVLVAFSGVTFWRQYEQFQNGFGLNPVMILLGLYMLFGALNRFRSYGQLRRLFAERPEREHVVWFDDLVREIHRADPQADELVLDLPTRPHWKAKLLGGTAFFVAPDGITVWVAGPDDFILRREKIDPGHGTRNAILSIYGQGYPAFELADVCWENYTKWIAQWGSAA
jgi:hypothetical protein